MISVLRQSAANDKKSKAFSKHIDRRDFDQKRDPIPTYRRLAFSSAQGKRLKKY